MSELWPTELRVSKDRRRLAVSFNDGARFELSAELLRVLSPSAEVQGHGPGQRVGGVVDHHVPDDPAEARPSGSHRGARETGQVEDVLDGQTHAFAPAGPLVSCIRARLCDRPIATERDRLVTGC